LVSADFLQNAVQVVRDTLSTPNGMVALGSAGVASILMIAGSFVKTMIPLRWLAVGSNVFFVVYGLFLPNPPMLILHAVLLPINIYRAGDMMVLTRRVNAAAAARDTSGLWLRPYMKRRKLKPGTVLFHKGDPADHLYMLVSGRMELVEIGAELPLGRMFGEIALFSPDRQRTLTARCVDACQVLSIDESTMRQIYYQNPDFGFQMIGLVASRLVADVHRLEAAVAAAKAAAATAAPTPAVAAAPAAPAAAGHNVALPQEQPDAMPEEQQPDQDDETERPIGPAPA
jgi:CRP/FNR family transcriptional regulator, cyclic AMP receptor protein